MDIRKVKKLIELLEESGIDELEIKEGEESVRISRHSKTPAQQFYAPAPMPAPAAAPVAVAPAATADRSACCTKTERHRGHARQWSVPSTAPLRQPRQPSLKSARP